MREGEAARNEMRKTRHRKEIRNIIIEKGGTKQRDLLIRKR